VSFPRHFLRPPAAAACFFPSCFLPPGSSAFVPPLALRGRTARQRKRHASPPPPACSSRPGGQCESLSRPTRHPSVFPPPPFTILPRLPFPPSPRSILAATPKTLSFPTPSNFSGARVELRRWHVCPARAARACEFTRDAAACSAASDDAPLLCACGRAGCVAWLPSPFKHSSRRRHLAFLAAVCMVLRRSSSRPPQPPFLHFCGQRTVCSSLAPALFFAPCLGQGAARPWAPRLALLAAAVRRFTACTCDSCLLGSSIRQ
jgi:hypothetical protein